MVAVVRQSEKNIETGQFQKLLDTHEPITLRQGQLIKGEIIKLEENFAIVDVGAKRDAIVPPEEINEVDENFLEALDEGDNVTVYVTRTPTGDEELYVSLKKGLQEQDWQRAAEYLENQEVLELRVTGGNRGGFLVKFGQLQGFVPASHAPRLQRIRNQRMLSNQANGVVGEELLLKVIEVDRQKRRLVLSARQARKELRRQRLLKLNEMIGATISGRVTNLVKFGAFVDIGGVEGLVHISEISWAKVEDPAERLSPGEEIEVSIVSVDVEQERISLSLKALLPSPWNLFTEQYTAGDLVEGVVTNVVDFGAFLQVAEGIEGLIHVSEMNGTREFEPKDILQPGDVVLTRILGIQPKKQRLSLSQHRVRHDEELEWILSRQQEAVLPEAESGGPIPEAG